jgi:hypothetical protein
MKEQLQYFASLHLEFRSTRIYMMMERQHLLWGHKMTEFPASSSYSNRVVPLTYDHVIGEDASNLYIVQTRIHATACVEESPDRI